MNSILVAGLILLATLSDQAISAEKIDLKSIIRSQSDFTKKINARVVNKPLGKTEDTDFKRIQSLYPVHSQDIYKVMTQKFKGNDNDK